MAGAADTVRFSPKREIAFFPPSAKTVCSSGFGMLLKTYFWFLDRVGIPVTIAYSLIRSFVLSHRSGTTSS